MRFLKLSRIHFVGIGGVGMSGLAELLLSYPLSISGCDSSESDTTRRLRSLGIPVSLGHSPGHLDTVDLLVITSALAEGNDEVRQARAKAIPVIRRAEMLGEIMRLKQGIAVSGTHGKTTTTSMIGAILLAAGLDPTILVGGRAHYLGTNARLGKGEWLVAEADEYDRSFLELTPVLAVVTNVEEDHLDCYRDLGEIMTAFTAFANRVPFYGAVFVGLDDPNASELIQRFSRRVVTFGESPQASLRARDIALDAAGAKFTVAGDEPGFGGEMILPLPGRHNVRNALAATAVARELSIPFATVAKALAGFDGVARRFEVKGERGDVLVVDDYAHHPTEVSATLAAARQAHPRRRLVALFQPHLYSRTRDFAREFGRALNAADVALVTEVYASREAPIPGVSGRSVVDQAVSLGHRQASFLETREDVGPALENLLRPGDLLLTMGAGDVYRFGETYLGGAPK
ncbi:MAG: UDP-N-acetylmuramate--L-alanine ligase [Thermoanaerobaculia bacterium]